MRGWSRGGRKDSEHSRAHARSSPKLGTGSHVRRRCYSILTRWNSAATYYREALHGELEHRSTAFPRCHPDGGSLPCAPVLARTRGQTLSQRFSPPKALDDDQAGQTGLRQNSKLSRLFAHSGQFPSRVDQADPHRSRLFSDPCRMHALPQFRRQKLFVGSGVIEAGRKTITGTRLKQSGMCRTVRGPTPSSPSAVADSAESSRTTGNPVEVEIRLLREASLRLQGGKRKRAPAGRVL
jgi:hypothetical protein